MPIMDLSLEREKEREMTRVESWREWETLPPLGIDCSFVCCKHGMDKYDFVGYFKNTTFYKKFALSLTQYLCFFYHNCKLILITCAFLIIECPRSPLWVSRHDTDVFLKIVVFTQLFFFLYEICEERPCSKLRRLEFIIYETYIYEDPYLYNDIMFHCTFFPILS